MNPFSTSKRCIEPPLPLTRPVPLPYSSAITSFGVAAEEEGVGVVAVGGDDLVAVLVESRETRWRPPPGRCRRGGSRRSCPCRKPRWRGILEEADRVHLPVEIERRLGIEVLGFGSVARWGRASWSLLRLRSSLLRLRDRRLATTAFSSGSGPSLSPCARLSRLRRIAPVVASRIRCSCHGVARGIRRPRRPDHSRNCTVPPALSWRGAGITAMDSTTRAVRLGEHERRLRVCLALENRDVVTRFYEDGVNGQELGGRGRSPRARLHPQRPATGAGRAAP